MIKGKNVFRFSGGLILRYEEDKSATGRIKIFNAKPKEEPDIKRYTPLARPIDDLKIFMTEDGNLQLAEPGAGAKLVWTSKHYAVTKTYGVMLDDGIFSLHLDWSRSNFSDFCIDLLSNLEGLAFDDKNKPVFGQVFDNIDLKKAPLQPSQRIDGKPFVEIKMYEGGKHGEKFSVEENENQLSFKILVEVSNTGEVGTIISDDLFKSKCELLPGKSVVRVRSLVLDKNDENANLRDLLDSNPISFPYRIVYHPIEDKKELLAVERQLKITTKIVDFE